MSETSKFPAKDSKPAQEECCNLSNLNFSISINITLSPELKAVLEKIAGYGIEPAPEEEIPVLKNDVDIIQTVVQKEPEKKYGRIVYRDDNWNEKIKEYPNLQWKEENDTLLLKYKSGKVTTDWKEINIIKKMCVSQLRDWFHGKEYGNNQKTAVRTFLTCIREGRILQPGLKTKDQDAEFKPMLAPFYSTRPDANCGKVEVGGMIL